jgi:possible TPS family two-partner secretion exoprotein tpsA
MDKDSEVTADGYYEEAKAGLKKAGAASSYGKLYEELEESGKSPEEINRILAKGNKDLKLEFGEIDKKLQKELDEEKDAGKRALLVKKKIENSTDPYEQEYYKAYYNHLIRKSNPKEAFFNSAGKGAVEGIKTLVLLKILGVMLRSKPNITIPKSSKFYKDTRYPISAEDLYVISVNDPEYYKDNSHLYKVTDESNVKAGLYNKKIEDPVILKHMTEYHNNTLTSNEKLGYSVGNLGTYVVGNKILNRLDTYI